MDGIIGDGECQGYAQRSPEPDVWIGREGPDGGLLGDDKLWMENKLLEWIEEIVLDEQNVQEAATNLIGAGMSKAIGAIANTF